MFEFYHTFNRGVEKRKIFLEDADYFRGVHDLFEFNDTKEVVNLNRRIDGFTKPIRSVREKLVDVIVWCLMPNHFHFFTCPLVENGLSKFHKKFGIGFANFFNLKYQRSGVLFQGRYKKVQVVDDRQALQLICYIHSNPLELWRPNWKENGLRGSDISGALKFLEEYRWSSYLDWIGIKNFPSLIESDFIQRFFKDSEEYKEFFANWLRYYVKNTKDMNGFILD